MGDGQVAEAEGEGLGAAAALDELAELQLDDVEAGVEEPGGELAADLAGEDGAAEVEGAAGHAGGVGLGDGDALALPDRRARWRPARPRRRHRGSRAG